MIWTAILLLSPNPGLPIWMCLEPLQAWMAAYCNSTPPPVSLERGQFFAFSCLRPLYLGSYYLNTQFSSSLAMLRARCAQTFTSASSILDASSSYSPHRVTSGGGNANCSIRSRIAANNLLVTATSAAVPEPTTCALALAALCLAMSRRRAF